MSHQQTGAPDRSSSAMPLDVKVLAAVASLVVLLVVSVAIAIALVVSLGNNASQAERQARFTDAVKAAALHAKGLANDERGLLISGSSEFLVQMEGRIELARSAFQAAEQSASPDQRSTVAEAREGFERWLEAIEVEIALFEAGDEEAAIAHSLDEARALRKAYEGWLSDATTLGVNAFQDATAAVAGSAVASVLILVAYLLVAVVVGAVVALWIVRTVLRPSYALVRLLADAQEESPV